MAKAHRHPFRNLHFWEEKDCLNYYGMLSLHEVFEIVGSQLTETDIEVLSFLLNETFSPPHFLDPAGWTVEPSEDNPDDLGVSPSPQLLHMWRRLNANTSPHPLFVSHKPWSGLELLLELDKKGYISDGNLEPLLQLLRVLTRHDLLPFVSHKKRRTVSPERERHWHGAEHRELTCPLGMRQSCRQTEMPLSSFTQQWRTGFYTPSPVPPVRKRRKKRGNGWSRRPKKSNGQSQPPPAPIYHKVSCGKSNSCLHDLSVFLFFVVFLLFLLVFIMACHLHFTYLYCSVVAFLTVFFSKHLNHHYYF